MKDLTKEDRKSGPSLYLRFLRFLEKITKKKFLIKLAISAVLFFIIFFPSATGDVIGSWYNKLVNSFIEAAK